MEEMLIPKTKIPANISKNIDLIVFIFYPDVEAQNRKISSNHQFFKARFKIKIYYIVVTNTIELANINAVHRLK